MFDFLHSLLESHNDSLKEDLTLLKDENKNLYNNINSHVNNEFDVLEMWIKSPQYSPDHPLGAHYVNCMEEKYKNVLTKKD